MDETDRILIVDDELQNIKVLTVFLNELPPISSQQIF